MYMKEEFRKFKKYGVPNFRPFWQIITFGLVVLGTLPVMFIKWIFLKD